MPQESPKNTQGQGTFKESPNHRQRIPKDSRKNPERIPKESKINQQRIPKESKSNLQRIPKESPKNPQKSLNRKYTGNLRNNIFRILGNSFRILIGFADNLAQKELLHSGRKILLSILLSTGPRNLRRIPKTHPKNPQRLLRKNTGNLKNNFKEFFKNSDWFCR